MFETPLNQKTVTVKLRRIDLCDLMLACTAINEGDPETKKWAELHDKLKEILSDFDAKHGR